MSNRFRTIGAMLTASALVLAACGSDDDDAGDDVTTEATADDSADGGGDASVDESTDDTTASATTQPATTEPDTTEPDTTEPDTTEPDESGDGTSIDEARCERNREAGTITFVTGFDFSASAGIVEAIVADAEGFFDQLCLDVELQPGFAPSNGALVIEGAAQMSSAASFAELAANNVNGEGDLVALLHWGRTSIEAIVLPDGSPIEGFDDLCGNLVGIKGDLPYSLQAAVALSGIERSCFDEVLLDGFDPVAHLDLGIDALPVYKSNEPNTLEREGVPFSVLDPRDFDVPSSFAIPFTSQAFLDEHPDAVADFTRAMIKGYEFAAENPELAVDHAFALIDAAGNPFFFAVETEVFRWTTESGLIAELSPEGVGKGIPDVDRLEQEIEAMTAAGVFEELPDWQSMINTDVAEGLYDGTELIWPGP